MGDFFQVPALSDGRSRVRLSARSSAMAWVAVVAVGMCGAVIGTGTEAQAQAQTPGPGLGTKTMPVLPAMPLLPATLGKLKRVAEGDGSDGLGLVDASDAAAMSEDGLRRFARSEYAGVVPGAAQGWVTVYKFGDVSGAVAAYDYFRRPGMRAERLGDEAVSDGDALLLRSGANVVVGHFKLNREAMLALTGELTGGLPKVVGAAANAPLLPTLLPRKGIDAESARYALGPAGYKAMGGVLPAAVVGFDKNAEAVTARNAGGGVLTLLLYPTPEIAGEHERAIDALSRQPGRTTGSASSPASSVGSALAGTVKMRREGTLVVLTTGAWPVAEAESMVNGIHLRDEVTWDKPMPLEFHTELQKTYSLLVSIAILSGVGVLAALVLGLFLGGGRALVRILQGKPAASEPEFLRIDLSGPVGKRLRGPEA